jgi:hypothetical protein
LNTIVGQLVLGVLGNAAYDLIKLIKAWLGI